MDWGWLISFFIYQSNRTFERTKPRMTIYESNGFFFEFLGWRGSRGDEPVVSHEELGASDHSSVEYGMYCLIGSCPLLGLCPRFEDLREAQNFFCPPQELLGGGAKCCLHIFSRPLNLYLPAYLYVYYLCMGRSVSLYCWEDRVGIPLERGRRATTSSGKWPTEPLDSQNDLLANQNHPRISRYVSEPP